MIRRYFTLVSFVVVIMLNLPMSAMSQGYIGENGTILSDSVKSKKTSVWDKMVFGGSFWIMPSSYYGYNELYIDISPMAGYMFTKHLIVGNYFIYRYYSNDYYKTNTSFYGIKPYAYYSLFRNIDDVLPFNTHLNTGLSLMLEQDLLSYERKYITGENGRMWVGGTLAGIGITQPMGIKGAFFISILWQVAGSTYYSVINPGNPYINFGFYF